MKKLLLLFLFLPLISVAQLNTSWKDARFLKDPLKNLMVVSQFYEQELREKVEVDMIAALQKKGIGAVPASKVLIYDSLYLYSTLERKLDSAAIDGILFIKMIEIRSTDMYILPQELIPPYAYNYYEYYSYYYYNDLPLISDPNYYRKPRQTFRIDIYLYQNKGDMAVWGGQTKMLDPLHPEKVLKSMPGKAVKKMLSEGVVEAQ